MADFVKVATVDDVPEGAMKKVSAGGNDIMIVNVDGEFYAIGRICTHTGGPLDQGKLDGKMVMCPWHKSEFDVTTGQVYGGPATENQPAYEVKVEGKDILVKA